MSTLEYYKLIFFQDVMVPNPTKPDMDPFWTLEKTILSGTAYVQYDTLCDVCGGPLQKDELVLSKRLEIRCRSLSSSVFSPTCMPCVDSGFGGYLFHLVSSA